MCIQDKDKMPDKNTECYRNLLEKLVDYKLVKGKEVSWIYLKDKKFKTGLYFCPKIEEDKPFLRAHYIFKMAKGDYLIGSPLSLNEAADYLAEHNVKLGKLKRRIKRIIR